MLTPKDILNFLDIISLQTIEFSQSKSSFGLNQMEARYT